MKALYYAFTILLLIPVSIFSQSSDPAQEVDYKSGFDYETNDEGFQVINYYLQNLSDKRIMFFDFQLKPNEYDFDVLQGFPQDVLILDPNEKKVYYKCLSITGCPGCTWNTEFMENVTGSVDDVEKDRDYVFYYSYVDSDGMIDYTYYLKNISGKNIRFYDFDVDAEENSYTRTSEIPSGSLILGPGEAKAVFSFYIYDDQESPQLLWYARFQDEYVPYDTENLSFCDGVRRVIYATDEEEMESVKGNLVEATDFVDYYECTIHIEGMNDEEIMYFLISYDYAATVGNPGSFEEAHALFEEYRGKLKECLPADGTEDVKWGGDEDIFKIKAVYEGEHDDIPYYIELEILSTYSSDDEYKLKIYIEQPTW